MTQLRRLSGSLIREPKTTNSAWKKSPLASILEYWVEENVKPNTPSEIDRVLHQHIRPIVHYLKQKDLVVFWHFLRESGNWRGDEQPLTLHIRFRVRTQSQTDLNSVRTWLTTVLDGLQSVGKIADHYRGNHGTPNQDYGGESANFDETGMTLPQGWIAVQRGLQAGSEIELVFLSSVFRGARLAPRFRLPDILHFMANQCGKNHDWTANGRFMIVEM